MAVLRSGRVLTVPGAGLGAAPAHLAPLDPRKTITIVLDKHLPLDAAADIIGELGLKGSQIKRANQTMQRIVRNAWNRLPAARRPPSFDEFADAVPAHDWALMFEVCALGQLGRDAEACALITAARHLRAVHSDCARRTVNS